MKTKTKLSEDMAILDNLIFGTALPPSLERKRALPAYAKPRWVKDQTEQEQLRAQNEAIAKRVAEKIATQPLIAVCLNHSCACGNQWQSFGFFARRVTEKIEGEGDATYTRRCDPLPGEKPTATEWLPAEEPVCMKCYQAETNPGLPGQGSRIGGVTTLSTLIKMASH